MSGEKEREREAETDREGVCLWKGSYFASCFHREKKSADPMTVSSMNLLMKTGSLSTNWWGLPPTLQQTDSQIMIATPVLSSIQEMF